MMTPHAMSQHLQQLQAKLEKGTWYEVLGVADNADAATLKSAYLKHARTLHLDQLGDEFPPDLRERVQRTLADITRIHAELSDPAKRADYDAKRKLAAAGIPTDVRVIFQAEAAFNAGKRVLERGAAREALQKFTEACELNPSESDFQTYRRWAEYCLLETGKDGRPSDQGAVGRIVRHLKEAVDKSPNADMPHVFLGHIARNHDRTDEAMQHYRAALQRNRDNLEAQSGLRLLRMRDAKKKPGLFDKLFKRG